MWVLSWITVQWWVSDISNNLQNQLIWKATQFKYYSLVMDESTDINDTAQLLIFICGIDDNFEITEELAGFNARTNHRERSLKWSEAL